MFYEMPIPVNNLIRKQYMLTDTLTVISQYICSELFALQLRTKLKHILKLKYIQRIVVFSRTKCASLYIC